MDKTFFGNQINRLRGIYSATALSDERIDIWWKQFRHEPNQVFENALNHIIAESTTQALPAMSRISEALGFFRTNPNGASMQRLPEAHACPPCRDFGYGWNGDVIVRCSCRLGQSMHPQDLARAQKAYNAGAHFMRKGSPGPLPPLPYDPKERVGA